MYLAIKDYYQCGYYTNENMKIFVKAKWITPEDYEKITGIEYVE